jgi:hypothetical protein
VTSGAVFFPLEGVRALTFYQQRSKTGDKARCWQRPCIQVLRHHVWPRAIPRMRQPAVAFLLGMFGWQRRGRRYGRPWRCPAKIINCKKILANCCVRYCVGVTWLRTSKQGSTEYAPTSVVCPSQGTFTVTETINVLRTG